MDSSEVGQYGTLRLVKRLDPQSVVAAFPIDDDAVTFGRDPKCSVRLYYPSVSAVHAKIVFQDRKAFLVVLGTNGLLIDGCQVYPNPVSPNSQPHTLKPKTIPLTNNSEIEIHKKRFIFTYPPKNLRPIIPPTPTPTPNTPTCANGPGDGASARKRTLRLSMIHSAQVFSPRPSADPAVNLKVLQTPLRTGSSMSPVKSGGSSLMEKLREAAEDADADTRRERADGEGDEEIVLVDGNHPRVVQEEKDLVILEDVPYLPQPQSSQPQMSARSLLTSFPAIPRSNSPGLKNPIQPQPLQPLAQSPPHPPMQTSPPLQTPRRPGPTRASLHKAVLIRSAQRAVLRAEAESGVGRFYGNREGAWEMEEVEEMQVEENRVEEDRDMDMEIDRDEELEEEREVAAVAVVSSESEHEEVEFEEDEAEGEDEGRDDGAEEGEDKPQTKSVWRKSWENLVGFVRSGSVVREEDEDTQEHEHDTPHDHEDEGDAYSSEEEPVEEEEQKETQPLAPVTPEARWQPQTAPQQEQQKHEQHSQTYQRALGLGKFMTPQAEPRMRGLFRAGGGRYSADGGALGRDLGMGMKVERGREGGAWGGARRVRVETKWKVEDIVVPVAGKNEKGSKDGEEVTTPVRGVGPRVRLTEEERKAIQERRRSALRTPDTFFGGQAPGIGARRTSTSAALAYTTSPIKGNVNGKGTPGTYAYASPYKTPHQRQHKDGIEMESVNGTGATEGGEEGVEEETKVLLERMKETVEGMKRRRSEVPLGRISIGVGGEGGGGLLDEDEMDMDGKESDKENEAGSGIEADAIEVGGAEQDVPVRPTTPIPAASPTKTPHLDLKQMFATSSTYTPTPKTPGSKGVREGSLKPSDAKVGAEPKTPKMDGLRDMFRERKVTETPAFEGVGEMMRTPNGWEVDVLDEGAEDDPDTVEEKVEVEEVVARVNRRGRSVSAKPPSLKSTTATTRRKTPRSTAAGATAKTPVTEGRSNFADDEATPGDALGRVQEEDEVEVKDKQRVGKVKEKKPATRRGKSKPPVESDAEEDSDKIQKKARLIRGSRKVVDDIPEEPAGQPKSSRSRKTQSEEPREDAEAEASKPLTRKAKLAAKSKATPADDQSTSFNQTRRTAKVVDSGAPASEDNQAPALVKPVRKTQPRATKTTTVGASESEHEPVVKKRTTRKGRAGAVSTDDESVGTTGTSTGKRGTRAKLIAVNVEEGIEEDPLDSINPLDEHSVPATKGRRGPRSRTTTAEAVREEEASREEAAKSGTGKKTSSARKSSKAPSKSAVAPATPTLEVSEDGVDKENTPSVEDEEPVKAKKVHREKAPNTSLAEEMDVHVDVPLPIMKPRATRTTRARK